MFTGFSWFFLAYEKLVSTAIFSGAFSSVNVGEILPISVANFYVFSDEVSVFSDYHDVTKFIFAESRLFIKNGKNI